MALSALLTQLSGERAAADTGTDLIVMSSSVTATCTISVSVALSFAAYDINAVTPDDVTGNFSVSCSMGAPVYVALGQGNFPHASSTESLPVRQMSAGGTDRLRYDLYRDAAHTLPWGNTASSSATLTGDGTSGSVNLYGDIPSGQSVMSGTYEDSVLATVTF